MLYLLICMFFSTSLTAQVYMSYLEIYNEQIRDLLSPSQGVHLELREDREQVHVAGLSEVKATSTNEVGITFSFVINTIYLKMHTHFDNVAHSTRSKGLGSIGWSVFA